MTENQLLAALRFVTCLEKVRNQQPKLGYSTEMNVDKTAMQPDALRQLRALDFTLRGMVREAAGRAAARPISSNNCAAAIKCAAG